MTAIQLIPTAEFALQSNRGGEYIEDPFFWRSALYALFGVQDKSILVPSSRTSSTSGSSRCRWSSSRSAAATRRTCERCPGCSSSRPWASPDAHAAQAAPRQVHPELATLPFFRLAFFPGLIAAFLAGAALSRPDWKLSRVGKLLTGGLAAAEGGMIAGVFVLLGILYVLRRENPPNGYV